MNDEKTFFQYREWAEYIYNNLKEKLLSSFPVTGRLSRATGAVGQGGGGCRVGFPPADTDQQAAEGRHTEQGIASGGGEGVEDQVVDVGHAALGQELEKLHDSGAYPESLRV